MLVVPHGTEHPRLKPVGVPRQFSVGTFIIIITLFGVLFAVLTIQHVHPITFGCITVFFMGIGIAQMFMFGGHEPRMASWITGIPLGFICGLTGFLLAKWNGLIDIPSGDIIGISIVCILMGGPCGYMAGCLIAGIFLVREGKPVQEKDDRVKSADEEQ